MDVVTRPIDHYQLVNIVQRIMSEMNGNIHPVPELVRSWRVFPIKVLLF